MMTSDCAMDEIGDTIILRDGDIESHSPLESPRVVVVGNNAEPENQRQHQHASASKSPVTKDDANDYKSPSLQSTTKVETSDDNNDLQNTIDASVQQHVMEIEMEPNDDATTSENDCDGNNNNNNKNIIDPSFQKHAMELNVALEALEAMRRANLTVEFSLAAASFPLRHDKCTYCQREALHKFLAKPKYAVNCGSVNNGSSSSSILKLDGSRIRRFHSSVGSYFSSSKTAGSEVDGNKSSATPMRSYHTSSSATQSNISPSITDDSGATKSNTNGGRSGSGNTTNTSSSTCSSSLGTSTSSMSMLKKVYHPCLTCGHPTCAVHSSSSLSKSRVTICQSCAYLYELEYLVETIASMSSSSSPNDCQQKVNDMIDCYDRAKLLLEYAAEYAEDIASALETNTARSNKIGVGSSASGIVSGVTGVIGCGALFFPPAAVAGVPLLIASLVFGTGATTVSSGDAAVRTFFSEPNRLANKMFALHGMVLSLLRITDVLRNELSSHSQVLTVSCSRDDVNEIDEEKAEERKSPQSESQTIITEGDEDRKGATRNGNDVAFDGITTSFVSTELTPIGGIKSPSRSSVMGRSTRYLGRVCTTASSSVSFIPIVGGVLSGASIYFEGKELKRTLSKISEGNPCAKAERVRSIKEQLDMLPDSKSIAAECRRLMERAHRDGTMPK